MNVHTIFKLNKNAAKIQTGLHILSSFQFLKFREDDSVFPYFYSELRPKRQLSLILHTCI